MAAPKNSNQTLQKVYDPDTDALRVNPIGGNGGFEIPDATDAVTVDYPTAETEVYEFREGGISGTVRMTITLTYSDSTKASLVSAVRT